MLEVPSDSPITIQPFTDTLTQPKNKMGNDSNDIQSHSHPMDNIHCSKIGDNITEETVVTGEVFKSDKNSNEYDINATTVRLPFKNYIRYAFNEKIFFSRIPQYNGDFKLLGYFLHCCDGYEQKLIDKDRYIFLAYLIFKLTGRASFIYEAKPITNWGTLKKDFVSIINSTTSIFMLHYQLKSIRQQRGQSLKYFIRNVMRIMEELTIATLTYNGVEIQKSITHSVPK